MFLLHHHNRIAFFISWDLHALQHVTSSHSPSPFNLVVPPRPHPSIRHATYTICQPPPSRISRYVIHVIIPSSYHPLPLILLLSHSQIFPFTLGKRIRYIILSTARVKLRPALYIIPVTHQQTPNGLASARCLLRYPLPLTTNPHRHSFTPTPVLLVGTAVPLFKTLLWPSSGLAGGCSFRWEFHRRGEGEVERAKEKASLEGF
jgi:hypothetical protein